MQTLFISTNNSLQPVLLNSLQWPLRQPHDLLELARGHLPGRTRISDDRSPHLTGVLFGVIACPAVNCAAIVLSIRTSARPHPLQQLLHKLQQC